ncbi:MAG: carboxypeptidase regulatory-like domain-containing protein [Gemmatimonadales bacterium]
MARLRLWSRAAVVSAGLLVNLATPPPSAAQQTTGSISGQLVDALSGAPIPSGTVELLGTRRTVQSDSAGRFTHSGLVPGTYILQIRAIGYAMLSAVIRLGERETATHVFDLEALSYTLPAVEVEGRPDLAHRRLLDFERRREAGRGYFITEAQITRSGASTLGDMLRGVPGVRIICNLTGCIARMINGPRACAPDYYMDGFPASNAATADMSVRGVIGVEIYRTLGETPLDFLRTSNRCGTIVIWTRSGP